MGEPITFIATIAKVQTMADGGMRVTLDLPETAVLQAALLMEVKNKAGLVEASLVAKMPKSVTGENYERLNE